MTGLIGVINDEVILKHKKEEEKNLKCPNLHILLFGGDVSPQVEGQVIILLLFKKIQKQSIHVFFFVLFHNSLRRPFCDTDCLYIHSWTSKLFMYFFRF